MTNKGLKPIIHDRSKDKSHKQYFGSLNAVKLPQTLGRSRMPIDNQDFPNDTAFCTGYAKSKAGAYMRGIDMSPEWQVAKEGEFAGRPIIDGTDPQTAMNAAVMNGFLPKILAPFTLEKDGADKISEWQNWPANLDNQALQYAPADFYAVADDPSSDTFDDIRVALYQAYLSNDRAPVMADGEWFQEWTMAARAGTYIMPAATLPHITYHDYLFIDFDTINGVDILIAHMSDGTSFGHGGFVAFTRDQINTIWDWKRQLAQGTGLYIFRSKGSRLQALIRAGYQLLQIAQNFLKGILYSQTPVQAPALPVAPSVPITPPNQPPMPLEPVIAPETLQWDTRKHIFHAVRVMCDNANLSVDDKDILCACLYVESQFYNLLPDGQPVKNINRMRDGSVGSTDWGLCQINDFYHIGPGKDFPSVDFVIQNPDKVVAWMIGMQKHGGLKQWVSYTSGAYKQYLPKESVMWQLHT